MGMRILLRSQLLSAVLGLWVAASPAMAVPDWLAPYPHADVREQRIDAADDYLLALGQFKRIGGNWQPEQSLRLQGELLRMTWRIPEGHTVDEVHRYWLDDLDPMTHRILFTCRGQACGSSHRWAGEVFGVRELAGNDASQRYDVLQLQHAAQPYTAALYTVQRGNQRVYTQLDLLALNDTELDRLWVTPDTLIRRLRGAGSVVLATFPEGDGVVPDIQLDALEAALRKDVRLRLEVHGYAYAAVEENVDTSALQQRAQDYAENLRSRLQERGIDPERVQVVGPDAMPPASFGPVDRIELQRQSS